MTCPKCADTGGYKEFIPDTGYSVETDCPDCDRDPDGIGRGGIMTDDRLEIIGTCVQSVIAGELKPETVTDMYVKHVSELLAHLDQAQAESTEMRILLRQILTAWDDVGGSFEQKLAYRGIIDSIRALALSRSESGPSPRSSRWNREGDEIGQPEGERV